ncbi:phosphoribosyltransferase [Paraburkholderia sp. MMS20-SJTN17]|uniref:Phosphoribosyltransferase n=1 Tax=Paraburkholderia translucens TaxID=2886945 RepID=A0ABS8K726_9BURK|nr:phosphoribosyltransferase [Paraburkholderia sp. MMS20-SJTN17]MCC8400519.1 phosphoribosyltransferase [Paraburkholderia sp. MMS20-SJTN17]
MGNMFRDRADAGRRLADALLDYQGRDDLVVLALPRGGVPVAFEVARALHAKLDVLIVRKLGAPGDEELAMGAIATGGALHLERSVLRQLGVSDAQLADVIAREKAELARRELAYRGESPPVPVEGKTVIVVDDGIATGASMQAALEALRSRHPARIVVAVPVSPAGAQTAFEGIADAFVSVLQPAWFAGISQFYMKFGQTTDEEVHACLAAARGSEHESPPDSGG